MDGRRVRRSAGRRTRVGLGSAAAVVGRAPRARAGPGDHDVGADRLRSRHDGGLALGRLGAHRGRDHRDRRAGRLRRAADGPGVIASNRRTSRLSAPSTRRDRVLRIMSLMADLPELGPRKSAVLRAVVEEYVRSGEPVGSETIAERAAASACPAPRSVTRWRRSRSSVTSATRTRAPGGSPPTTGIATTWTRCRPGGRLRETQRRAIAELLRRGDGGSRRGAEGIGAAALADDAVRGTRRAADGVGGAARAPGAHRHGAHRDDPRRGPPRPRRQASDRPARTGARRRICSTPTSGCSRSAGSRTSRPRRSSCGWRWTGPRPNTT